MKSLKVYLGYENPYIEPVLYSIHGEGFRKENVLPVSDPGLGILNRLRDKIRTYNTLRLPLKEHGFASTPKGYKTNDLVLYGRCHDVEVEFVCLPAYELREMRKR